MYTVQENTLIKTDSGGGLEVLEKTKAEIEAMTEEERNARPYIVTDMNVVTAEVVDNLTSTDTDKALSAKQGKVLDDKISILDAKNSKNYVHNAELSILGWTVPDECPIQNEVDGNTFTQKVGRVDLGSLEWTYRENKFYTTLSTRSDSISNKAFCSKYSIGSTYSQNNKTITFAGYHAEKEVNIFDTSYTDAASFKQSLQGVYLYYELAEEITHSLADENGLISKCGKLLYTFTQAYTTLTTIPLQGKFKDYNVLIVCIEGEEIFGDVTTFQQHNIVFKNQRTFLSLTSSDDGVYKRAILITNDSITIWGAYKNIYGSTPSTSEAPKKCNPYRIYGLF